MHIYGSISSCISSVITASLLCRCWYVLCVVAAHILVTERKNYGMLYANDVSFMEYIHIHTIYVDNYCTCQKV